MKIKRKVLLALATTYNLAFVTEDGWIYIIKKALREQLDKEAALITLNYRKNGDIKNAIVKLK